MGSGASPLPDSPIKGALTSHMRLFNLARTGEGHGCLLVHAGNHTV